MAQDVLEQPKADAAPPPTDKPAPATETAKTPTPEEIQAEAQKFIDAVLDGPAYFREKPKKAEEKPAEAPAEEKADEPPKEEPVVEPVLEQPKDEKTTAVVAKEPSDQKEEVTAEDEQARINAAVDARFNELKDTREPAPAPTIDPNHPDARVLQVVSEMQQANPGKYDGLNERITEFRTTESAYRRQWLKDNPGRKFDSKAEEHNDFYSESQPTFDQRDFERAEREMEKRVWKEEARAEARKEVEPELRQIRLQQQIAETKPLVQKAATEAMVQVLSAVPEFATAMDNGKNQFVLSEERQQRMQTANPVLYELAQEETHKVMTVVAELEKMSRLGANYRMNERLSVPLPNGESIRPHAEIADTLAELEASYAKSSEKKGRKSFISHGDRADQVNAIIASKASNTDKAARLKALDSAHWTVEAEDIRARVIRRYKGRLENFAKKIPAAPPKSNGAVASKNGQTAHQPKPAKASATPPPSGGSDTASVSDVVATPLPGQKAKQNSVDFLVGKLTS